MVKKIYTYFKKNATLIKIKYKYRKNKVQIETLLLAKDIKLGKMCKIGKKVFIGQNCTIGDYTYFNSRFNYSIIESNTTIGKYCSIGDGVIIGLGNHNYNYISTHPFLYDNYYKKQGFNNIKEKKINDIKTTIGNDVWIGANANIKRGIKIGDGAVIGMNTVVTKDVPPYAIVAGTPAKIIKYRFTEEQIQKILSSKWWDWPIEKINSNLEKFYDINKFN